MKGKRVADCTAVKTVVDPVVPSRSLVQIPRWYHAERLSVMIYYLADAPEGAGGFACIPGSHKSNFLQELPSDVRHFEVPHIRRTTAVEAGDCCSS